MNKDKYNIDENDFEDFEDFQDYYGLDSEDEEPKELDFEDNDLSFGDCGIDREEIEENDL